MAHAPTNWIKLTGSTGDFTLSFASRDWKVLSRLDHIAARNWMRAFGFSNDGPEFTTSQGLQIGYEVYGVRREMLAATHALFEKLESEQELLQFD